MNKTRVIQLAIYEKYEIEYIQPMLGSICHYIAR